MLVLNEEDKTTDEAAELRKTIAKDLPEIPGVRVFFREDAAAGGTRTPFAVLLRGPGQ